MSQDDPAYRGAVLFSERCSGCHTLTPAGTQGTANRALRQEGPNLDQRNESYDDVLFAINVLAADQAALARRFSTKEPHPEKWDGVAWEERAGTPKIDGTLIWLACELRDVHDGGDHAIATGRVLELEAGDGEPLIFHGGDYRPLSGEDSA